jgi:predicted Zn-ribbon and HTH transcriptional regulator
MDNNPLKQYFRRPAVYIRLPSGGKYYSSDVIETSETGEYPVYPMTAIDEISARTPDALFNGTAVADLIKSCIPAVKDPWSINSIDMDAVLIGIRAASGGDTLDVDSKCPECDTESTYGINLVGVLSTLKPGDYSKLLEIGELKIKFRPLMYREMNQASMAQFEVQKHFDQLYKIEDDALRNDSVKEALEKITFLTMDILSQTIEFVETPNGIVDDKSYILDFLKNCDKEAYIKIRDYSSVLKEDTEIKPADITCSNCGHQYKQAYAINPTDFFG